MRFFRWMLMLSVGMALTVSGYAQENDESALLRMLARVPDSQGDYLTFFDTAAIDRAYPQTERIPDWAALEKLGRDPTTLPQEAWWMVFLNGSTPSIFVADDELPATVGFDVFAVERELAYGMLPSQVVMLEGEFDESVIQAAFTTLGFTQADDERGDLWCGEAGCDAGQMVDLLNRNLSNPFGGDLGRQQPLVIGDNLLVSSSDIGQIDAYLDMSADSADSLADDARYQAAVAAVEAQGVLIQALVLGGERLDYISGLNMMEMFVLRSPPEVIEIYADSFLDESQTSADLPTYQLVIMTDVTSNTEQIALVGLVYANRDDAETAAALLPQRLESTPSLVSRRSWGDMLSDRRVEAVESQVVANENGQFVALLRFATPIAVTPEAIIDSADVTTPDEGAFTEPGRVFRLLVNAVDRRDTLWLNTLPAADVQALLDSAGN